MFGIIFLRERDKGSKCASIKTNNSSSDLLLHPSAPKLRDHLLCSFMGSNDFLFPYNFLSMLLSNIFLSRADAVNLINTFVMLLQEAIVVVYCLFLELVWDAWLSGMGCLVLDAWYDILVWDAWCRLLISSLFSMSD